MSSSALPWYLKGILYVALPAACVAALYLSIPGEVALARTAGWSENYAPAMPVCLSVYALSAGAIATYRRKMQLPGQITALVGSLAALILAMSAQSISHLIEQSYMQTSALLVVAVSCVPPLTIAHLVHMAETPSQVVTALEEKMQLHEVIDYLMVELTISLHTESTVLLSRAERTIMTCDHLKSWAGELTEEAEGVFEEIEEALSEKPGPKALTKETITAAAESLKQAGKKATVPNLCEALGISQATYYRYGGGKALTA
ncbi:hypothetical protein ACFV6G_00440 [Streptomyces lavendulae]|uniref:hypothetical protein n=1 Tax=Streptomyces lavendulae TaxID=1914 RepID=UPI00368D15B7